MADGDLGRDLFGAPVVARSGGRGRPKHNWSLENSNKVLLAFVRGLSVVDAAKVVGVSEPTLRRVYFKEVAQRAEARVRFEIEQLARLNDQSVKGNVAADKELDKRIEKLRARDQAAALGPAPTVRPPKLGKKEAARLEAERVRGLYEPPPPPVSRMN